ncbi:hypothetical protein L3Q82_002983 [Scortum barcoo]|uniref:Uncharacterized protein n=1 Tax=Scortum barcoo TaxID=214431 RepID=A0ACB8VRI6_9TELE|nr:hypothetical protein L3Q82_002983 [Scortum barcoo]
MSHREEASGKTQDTLERLCASRMAWERLGVPPEELEEVSGTPASQRESSQPLTQSGLRGAAPPEDHRG